MSTKKGKYGNPANRRPVTTGDLIAKAQPTGIADPRSLAGQIIGDLSNSRGRNTVVLDTTDAVLLEDMDVAVIERVRADALDGEALFMTLGGRVNKDTRQVRVGFIMGSDGAAALITELLAVADRCGPELLDDVTRRLTELHRGKHVDLHWLRAAIDNVIEADGL